MRKGLRLFDEADSPMPLRLISSQPFETGVMYLVYGPAESTPTGGYEDAKAHIPQTEGS
jgi:hypothetical protein